MESGRNLNSLCNFCQSGINLDVSESSVEICEKFQMYTTKFLNLSSCSQTKFEVTNHSVSDGCDDENCKSEAISCCAQCNKETETFCEMWESRELLQGEMIGAVANILNLTNHKFKSKMQVNLRQCLICQAAPMSRSILPGRIFRIKITCLKFITFVTRFGLNTEEPSFDKKILEMFVEKIKRRNSEVANLYCCDICLPKIETFCEMYEALESLQLEILHILDRFTIKNQCKDFQSRVEKRRKLSFPKVSLRRWATPINKLEQNQSEPKGDTSTINQDLEVHTQNENQLEDDFFDNFEIPSAPIPSSASFHLHDNGNAIETVPNDFNQTAADEIQKSADILESSNDAAPTMTKTMTTTKSEKKGRRGGIRKRQYSYPLECLFCRQRFTCQYHLGTHLKSHAREKWFWCRVCGKEFISRYSLRYHRKSNVHKEIPFRPHKCEICGKAYFHLGNLQKHSKLHGANVSKPQRPQRPFSCDICGKTFTRSTTIHNHKRFVHEGKRIPEVCYLCGKTVSSKFCMEMHLNKYHRSEIDDSLKKEKEFKCTFTDCHAAFYQRHHFDRHMLTHTGEKNFACEECGKLFALKEGLKQHQLCHLEVRPHVCGHCGKGFSFKYRLIGHEKKYHSNSST